jgi:hypothetical protein
LAGEGGEGEQIAEGSQETDAIKGGIRAGGIQQLYQRMLGGW